MKVVPQHASLDEISSVLLWAARLSFGAAIILIPFRLRLWTLPRPDPHLYAAYTDLLFFASDAAAILTVLLWSLALAFGGRRPSLGPRYVWIPLALFLSVAAAGVAMSADPLISAYQVLRLLLMFWFCFFIMNEVPLSSWLVVPITIQVCIQSLVGLGQFIVQRSLGLRTLGELSLDPSQSGIGVVVAAGVRLLRAYGLTDHPNILGGSLAFGLIILLALYLQGKARSAIWPTFALGVPALLVTFSRAAWLAFIAGSALLVAAEIVARRRPSIRSLAALALGGFIPVLAIILAHPGYFGARLDANNSFGSPTMEQQSIGERIILIDASMPLVLSHPLFGVGIGASPRALEREAPGLTIPYQPPHIAILDAAIETGLPGAVIYVFLLFAPFVIAIQNRGRFLSNRLAVLSLAVMLSLVIVGLFDYYTWLFPSGLIWQWLAWGLWGAAKLQPGTVPASSANIVVEKAGVTA